MRIWRVEHKDTGYGPYCSGEPNPKNIYSITNNRDTHCDQYHPSTWLDFKEFPEYNQRHGFPSKRRLNEWFSIEELILLIQIGYRVKVYHIPEEQVVLSTSCKQVLFSINE